MKILRKAFKKVSIISDFISSHQPLDNPEELLIRLEDVQEWKRKLQWEVDVLKTWLKLWQKCEKETWYRDAKDHIFKLERLLK